jgi:hypothetical protein
MAARVTIRWVGFLDLSVLEARAEALEYKAKIAQGENPVGQRDAERAALRTEKTFAQLVDEYLTLHAKPRKRSWREDKRMIRRYLPSSWSSHRLSDVTRHKVFYGPAAHTSSYEEG